MTKKPSDAAVIRQQTAVLSIAEGFFQARILFALLQLDVFERIGTGTRSVGDLAEEIGARPERLVRLLNAGVTLELLASQDGVEYTLPDTSRGLLLKSAGDHYMGNWLRNLNYFRAVLHDLDQAAAGTEPTFDLSALLQNNPEIGREFTLAMHDYAALRGKELGHFLDTSKCRSILDLGCGPGTYAFHLGLANPDLKLYLLDVPEVLEVAKEIEARYPLKNEITYLPQDAVADPVKGSYDLILASNMLHMLGEGASRELIARLAGSIEPGGSLVVQSQFLRADKMGGRWPICVDLLLLCQTENGHNHSAEETRDRLLDAGFDPVEFCAMSIYNTNSFVRGFRT